MGDLASPGAALFSLSVVLTAVIRVANHVECTSEHNRNQSDPKNSSKKLEIRESRRETARSTLSNDFHVAIIGGGVLMTVLIEECHSSHCCVCIQQALVVLQLLWHCNKKASSALCTSEIVCLLIASKVMV